MKKLFFLLLITSCIYGQTLTVWHTEGDPKTLEALDKIAKKFNNEFEGKNVRFQQVGWEDLYRKLNLAIEGGESPDITQIQPFMAYYLYKKGLLLQIDDLIEKLDSEDIFEIVKILQNYDGHYYGLATALGLSYYAYRKDLIPDSLNLPTTWSSYLNLLDSISISDSEKSPLLLPANDLHMTLLFTELLASNGGAYFDSNGTLDIANQKVVETLKFWKRLHDKISDKFKNTSYKENFSYFARGNSATLPNFFGRGILQIERDASINDRTPEVFSFFPHITGPSGKVAYSTLDAEPWCILKSSQNATLAKEFLLFFYREDNYMTFCESVPIHLTPIFKSLANSTKYNSIPLVNKWKNFYNYSLNKIKKQEIRPIFMADISDRFQTSLFKLEGSHIISNMIRNVIYKNIPPDKAVEIAVEDAKQLEQTSKDESSQIYLIILILIILIVILFSIGKKWKK
ncbi:MAG: extracellular solute-binding protein [Bacteroidetes bacterium]|nr:extracellular solute-binding protein [Bacteroidota bacterium]MBU1115035.1 extracellular solute-binding protein [Bacteroidota bacterium]MBU1799527.1 extracellular solute-binding protein [Bacteroidota bacterium]